MTAKEWTEAIFVLILLLPFFFVFLPREGFWQVLGFVYLAAICGYVVFFSPHRDLSRRARLSLLEVPIIVLWILFWLWAVLPRGKPGLVLGVSALAAALIYIAFISARRHGDTSDDWGLGNPARFLRTLRQGPKARAKSIQLSVANLLVLVVVLLARDQAEEILRRVVGQSTPFRIHGPIPAWVVALVFMAMIHLFLFCVIRYNNMRRAARIVGIYLAILLAFIAVAGYFMIYVRAEGTVELRWARGLKAVGTYVIWGTLQELLFLSYFNTRIRKGITSPCLSALLTAVVFSLFHLTAYELMTLCFFIGIVWALIFQAAPNVFLLGVAHGVSGGFGSAFEVHLPQGLKVPKIKATVGPFNL